jgi:predicted HAD superfamily Cof-like phosphohydrolase
MNAFAELKESPVTPMVAEFIRAFSGSIDARLWVKLVEEERAELIEAVAEGHDEEATLKELADLVYVTYGLALVSPIAGPLVIPEEEVEAILALCGDCSGLMGDVMAVHDWDEDVVMEAVGRVHASNMSKLGDDGKPIKREDGKVLKGPNYTPPDLSDLVAA